jgi:Predicted acyl esterases
VQRQGRDDGLLLGRLQRAPGRRPQPPALAAIIAVHATDDRYGDDCHYMGGGLLLGNLSWASTMLAYNARPPDPLVVGERWREMWLERLEGSPPFVLEWMAHPLRDDYWRHGSVAEDYAAIDAAIYTVGGWADPYTNCVLRLLAKSEAPVKALIGPWAHGYPHNARPAPRSASCRRACAGGTAG